MIWTLGLALAVSCGDAEGSSLETVLAGLGCGVPEFVTRTYIALAAVEEREVRWAGLAFLRVKVVSLSLGALLASQRQEIVELGMGALNARNIVPEVCLILKTIADLCGCVELSSSAADDASSLTLDQRVALLALITAVIVLVLLALGTLAGLLIAGQHLSSRADDLLANG